MKILYGLLMVIAIFVAINEQSKDAPNVVITCVAIVIFMYGVMRLSVKIPSKHKDENDDEVR